MIQTAIIVLITFVLVYLFYRYVIDGIKKTKIYSLAIERSLIAIFTVLSLLAVDSVLKYLVQPSIQLETKCTQSSVAIKIKVIKNILGTDTPKIDSIFIEYPVMGVITDYADTHPVTKAKSNAFVIGGATPHTLTNHVQIEISNVAPSAFLDYVVHYRAAETGKYKLWLIGTDKYEIRYTWKYKDTELTKTQWRLTKDDTLTEPPFARVWGGEVSSQPLPPTKTIPKRVLQ